MELERQLVDRGADERPEVLLVAADRRDRPSSCVEVLVVLGVAPRILGGEALRALDERLEVLFGLWLAPACEADHHEHDRAADDHRARGEHREPLEQSHRERIAEAGDQARGAEPDGERRQRRAEDAA